MRSRFQADDLGFCTWREKPVHLLLGRVAKRPGVHTIKMPSLWTRWRHKPETAFIFSTIDCCYVVLNTAGSDMCFPLQTEFGIFVLKALNVRLDCSFDPPRLHCAPNAVASQSVAVESHEPLLSANKNAPSLSGRKGSFVGHWSESYSP